MAWSVAVAVAAAAAVFFVGMRQGEGSASVIVLAADTGESQSLELERPPNEPPGYRVLTYVAFDAAAPAEHVADPPTRLRLAVPAGWEVSSSEELGLDMDDESPGSPPFVGRATFPSGLSDGVSPIWMRRELGEDGLHHLFVSFWFKLSDNWQGHETGVNKVGFAWMHDDPVVAFTAVGAGRGPLMPQLRLQDVEYERARNLVPNVFPASIERGRWLRWEILLVANRAGMRDGEVHWWIDGKLAGEYRNVVLAGPTQEDAWEVVTWRPVWGGRGDRVRETMYMWMDDLYVSGAR